MHIVPATRLKAVLDAHPALVDYLVGYHPVFGKLKNPVLRATVLRVATVADAAGMADIDPERLASDLQRAAAGDAAPGSPDGSDRQETLKGIIRELHDGASVEDVKARFDDLVRDVDSTEIAAMEQAIIAEGVPVEDVMRLCDVHVSVFKDALDATQPPGAPPGHPVHTYRLENEQLETIVRSLRRAIDEARAGGSLKGVVAGLDALADLDTHYTRKENQLFPLLEAHEVTGPTQVMWGLHDEIRDRLKAAVIAVGNDDRSVLDQLIETLGMVDDMIYKEEHILFPVALETLSEAEWQTMAAGEGEIGFAWIDEPAAGFAPTGHAAITPADIHAAMASGGTVTPSAELDLTTGRLTLEQLDRMLRALPVDITFVGADDRVRYYSEGHRVFPRSPAVIGRAVTNCHPPSSVDKVVAIVEAFRAGTKDTAEFWITMGGRFLSIRYFALRADDGTYEGCLEVTQDVTDLRALEGERRLLDW